MNHNLLTFSRPLTHKAIRVVPLAHYAVISRHYTTLPRKKYVLGIETSCDDTAVAVVSSDREIIAERDSQWLAHKPFGGIMPVVATQEHAKSINPCVDAVMQASGLSYADLSAVAVTSGPGLAYCLEVGIKKAKEIASTHNLPLIGVNHMEGHALTVRLTNPEVEFPFLVFLVSGGHTQLTLCKGIGNYMHLGGTLDNALGEVYDKIARELDILYSQEGLAGGEAVEILARDGDSSVHPVELPLKMSNTCDFSFSGMLSFFTKKIKEAKEKGPLDHRTKADFAASFQRGVIAHVEKNTQRALTWTANHLGLPVGLVVSGGVARNAAIRASLSSLAERAHVRAVFPPVRLCTDNGVMIGWAGLERLNAGLVDAPEDVIVRPRWPLDKSGKVHYPATTKIGGTTDQKHKQKSNYVVSQ